MTEKINEPKKSVVTELLLISIVGVIIGVSVGVTIVLSNVDTNEIPSLKEQILLLNQTVNFHQQVLQQHNAMIIQHENNTDIIVEWAKNTEQRITILEEQK